MANDRTLPNLSENTLFEPDSKKTSSSKNFALATLLQVTWSNLEIVRVERIEIGSAKGWRATYRD
jgi:hypothetical protein